MGNRISYHWWMIFVLAAFWGIGGAKVKGIDSARVKTIFSEPGCEYATSPLWVWNDMLTDEQIVSTLRDLADQSVKQVFVHPRPGLMTPYLSNEWFRLWKVALEEAKKLDMNIWIYDENSYPSGFAGGFVPDEMPQSRGKGLVFDNEKKIDGLSNDVLAVFEMTDDGYQNVTARVRAGKLPESKYLIVRIVHAKAKPWHGGKSYVDLIKPGVTAKFLEITLDKYKSEIGDEFGRTVPGVFTDEPHLKPAGDLHWTDDLENVFKKRWRYSLVDNLPSLVGPVGNWKQVRHNYYQLLMELFIERWAKPYYEYCQRNGLEFTGHYWEHEWPNCTSVQDNMAMSAWQHRPGIDTLMNQYSADSTHAQFGNVRSVKEISSVANQLGRQRTLCEAYGAGGWDLRFEDMKRIGDWLYVLGINTLNEHLSYITIRGARKRDHPQSLSYHEPWWLEYHVLANYFTRLSAIMSQGEQINKILVLEPTTTAWMYQFDPAQKQTLETLGMKFQQLVTGLAEAQVEFDIGCEDIMAHNGSVEGTTLKVGCRKYSTVVLPPMTENLNLKTVELLENYIKGGGEVLCCGNIPTLVNAVPSERCNAMLLSSSFRQVAVDELTGILLSDLNDGFSIRADKDSKGILLHHRRQLDDGEILFITNTHINESVSGVINSNANSIERWDIETGKILAYEFGIISTGVSAKFELAPCGSLLLFLSNKSGEPAPSKSSKDAKIAAAGTLKIQRVAPNVLTLDYMDVTAGGQTKNKLNFYQANQFAFEKNGIGRNPWDSAVQFKDELITKKFPPESGFGATYRFFIEQQVPRLLWIVVERPDLYTITCNGKTVEWENGQWWLDKSFGRIDISSAAKIGDNEVIIKASPFTIYHELESAYVLGSFVLRPAKSGFVVVPDEPLELGKWNEQGHPFYAEGVSYTQSFDVLATNGKYYVQLGHWYGSVAKVIVNGKEAGHIYHQPWEYEVTDQISVGVNTIEIVVIGTLKNTLGPHHGDASLGSAWPAMFKKVPLNGPPEAEEYKTIGYGLFEPFELVMR